MGLVEVMNLGFEFFDAPALLGTGQFKAAGGRNGTAIDKEKIAGGRKTGADNDKKCPEPFTLPDSMNEHPDLECENNDEPRVAVRQNQQCAQHASEARRAKGEWQQRSGGGNFGEAYRSQIS